jgi:hypothetical protein
MAQTHVIRFRTTKTTRTPSDYPHTIRLPAHHQTIRTPSDYPHTIRLPAHHQTTRTPSDYPHTIRLSANHQTTRTPSDYPHTIRLSAHHQTCWLHSLQCAIKHNAEFTSFWIVTDQTGVIHFSWNGRPIKYSTVYATHSPIHTCT